MGCRDQAVRRISELAFTCHRNTAVVRLGIVDITASSDPTTSTADTASRPAPDTSVAAPANQPPITVPDLVSSVAGTRVSIDVLANDIDPDGAHLQLEIVTATAPANGTAVHTESTIGYKPADGFTGTDTFTYTVADANGSTSTPIVTIDVIAPNDT